MGPPEKFDRTQAPKEFWMDSHLEEPLTGQEEIQVLEEFKKGGGRYSTVGRRPTTPPSFPRKNSVSEGGYVERKSGCDDSPRTRHKSPKRVTLVSESSRETLTDSDMPDLE